MSTGINLFLLQKNRELRQHAKGAGIALLHDGEEWVALMEDAGKARKAAGTLGVWKDLGDGAQQMSFGDRDMVTVLKTLAARHTVALMERVTSPPGQFLPPYCCLWIVERTESSAYPREPDEVTKALEELITAFEAEIDSEYSGCGQEMIEEKLAPATRARSVLDSVQPPSALVEPSFDSMLD